jgi:hypothetical protein
MFINSNRRIHFSDKLFEVYYVENYCRKGIWEECARDRVRFQRRILQIQTVLDPILNHLHRTKVYESMLNEEFKHRNVISFR